jgi:hypothetical protein
VLVAKTPSVLVAKKAFNDRKRIGPRLIPPENSRPKNPLEYFRLQDELRTYAKTLELYINENSKDPDAEGFLGRKGSWNRDFIIRDRDGKLLYQGRIKLIGDFMAVVKDSRNHDHKIPIDLREVRID